MKIQTRKPASIVHSSPCADKEVFRIPRDGPHFPRLPGVLNVQCQQPVEKLGLLSLRTRAHSGAGSSNLGFYKSISYRLLRRKIAPRNDMQGLFQQPVNGCPPGPAPSLAWVGRSSTYCREHAPEVSFFSYDRRCRQKNF